MAFNLSHVLEGDPQQFKKLLHKALCLGKSRPHEVEEFLTSNSWTSYRYIDDNELIIFIPIQKQKLQLTKTPLANWWDAILGHFLISSAYRVIFGFKDQKLVEISVEQQITGL
jgi:hypothetical protein